MDIRVGFDLSEWVAPRLPDDRQPARGMSRYFTIFGSRTPPESNPPRGAD